MVFLRLKVRLGETRWNLCQTVVHSATNTSAMRVSTPMALFYSLSVVPPGRGTRHPMPESLLT